MRLRNETQNLKATKNKGYNLLAILYSLYNDKLPNYRKLDQDRCNTIDAGLDKNISC